jgi:RND family efflux transporter MFP subunit
MKFSIKRVFRPLAILVIGLVLAIVMVSSRKPIPQEETPQRLPFVELQTMQLDKQEIVISARGNLIPAQSLVLSSEVGGAIVWKSEKLERGEFVAAGEPLIKIEPIPYELALAQAKATLASARVALADAEALQRKARVEEAKANINAAEKLVKKAELDLSKTTITSPFNAIVDSAPVEFAQFMSPGKLVAELMSTDKGEVHMPLVQSDAVYLVNNQPTKVMLNRLINGHLYQWQGRYVRLEGRLDQQTRVINAVVEIDNPYEQADAELPLVYGAFVEVTMVGDQVADAEKIPQLALHPESTVFVFEDGKIRKRTVDIVHYDGKGEVIIRGLNNGDRVVTNRLEVMFDQMLVAVKNEQ